MAVPTFVKFSRARYPREEALQRLAVKVFRPWNLAIESAGQLRASHINFDGGLELVDDRLYPCGTELDALRMSSDWDSLGLVYVARAIPCKLYVYFFDKDREGCACTLDFDSSLLYFESEDFKRGEWLKGFLAEMPAVLNADVCGYGAYALKHESLDTKQLVSRLRNGQLLKIENPVFHAFSVDVVTPGEMEEVLRTFPQNPNLTYSLTVEGYHTLSALS
jgi:hypothetical protein